MNNGNDDTIELLDHLQIPDFKGYIQPWREQPPNLSRLWNVGFDVIRNGWIRDGDIAVLNDDAIVPPTWFTTVQGYMRDLECAAGCMDPDGLLSSPQVLRQRGPVSLSRRMVGYAFMLRGELGLRANENLHWYFTDDHLDWTARENGGMVMVPGPGVEHLHPNGQLTQELSDRIAVDAATFKEIWGVMPW